MRGKILGLVVVLWPCGPCARGDVAILQASQDNTLFEIANGSISNGAGAYLFTGTIANGAFRRGLIAFDVASAIPAGSMIESVRLTLHMSRSPTAGEINSLHRLTASWGEGASDAPAEEGGGTDAAAGDATWLHRFFPGDLWNQPGGDFVPTPSADAVILGVGHYTWGSTPNLVADAQAWVDQPASNFGWLLSGNEEFLATAKRFDSRENPEPAFRPTLVVEYTLVPEPTGILSWLLAAIACNFRFSTR